MKIIILKLKEEVASIKQEISVADKNIDKDFRPQIQRMKNSLQERLINQKTENFKLIKEIAILEKEKSDIQGVIYTLLGKLHRLEREIGVKSKAYTCMFDQSIIDNETNNKFIIDKEDI